jgi:hypothetical protein
MHNLLDTARITQSLDGERLMGRVRYPKRIIFSDLADYK